MSKYRYLWLATIVFALLFVITLVLWLGAVAEQKRISTLKQQENQAIESYTMMGDIPLPEGVKECDTGATQLKSDNGHGYGSHGSFENSDFRLFEHNGYYALDISNRPQEDYTRIEDRLGRFVLDLAKKIRDQYPGKANISFAYAVGNMSPSDITGTLVVIRLKQRTGAPQGTITVFGYYPQHDGQIRKDQVNVVIHRAFGPFFGTTDIGRDTFPNTQPQTK